MDINRKEAHAISMMLHNLRYELTGRKILLYVDNSAVCYTLYKCWAKSEDLMDFIYEITLVQCMYKIEIYVQYIPSEMNVMADALSRKDFARFQQEVRLFGFNFDTRPVSLSYYERLYMVKH